MTMFRTGWYVNPSSMVIYQLRAIEDTIFRIIPGVGSYCTS